MDAAPVSGQAGTVREQDDATGAAFTAVVAHGLLNAVAIARGSVETAILHWDRLDDERKQRLLKSADDQLILVSDMLGDLVRGIPAEARSILDDLVPRSEPAG